MADIDKSLPNVKRPEEEVAEEIDVAEIEETSKGPVEITEDEEGATIDFDPNAMPMPQEGDHFANLNELLPEDETSKIGNQLQNDFGKPDFIREDGNTKIVRFDGSSCSLFLYFDSLINKPMAEYFEIRNKFGELIERKEKIEKCFAEVVKT